MLQLQSPTTFTADPVLQQHLTQLMSLRGQIATVKTQRRMKTRKEQPEIIKHSEFQCLVGVDYETLQSVIDGRADGTKPATNQGLPWGEWVAFPYVIEHKGEFYFRCTRADTGFYVTPRYTIGGVDITREEAQAKCLASEFRDGDESEVFNIRVSSIVDVQ